MPGKSGHWNGHKMKAPIIKDKSFRKTYAKQELKLRCLKFLKINPKLSCTWWARHKLACFSRQIHKNRCLVTYRGPSTNREFKLSRLEFRRWAQASKLPGLVKGSW